MLSPAPHTSHRSLHVLRASLVSQFSDHRDLYRGTGSLGSKCACLAFEQAVKEIDALLDDVPTDLSADRDRLDNIENIARLAGRDPGEDAGDRQDGTHTRPARRVGAWGQLIGIVLVGAVVLAGWAWKVGE